MPDLHKGDRFPIGCAIVAEGISPALIESDIGCAIAIYLSTWVSPPHLAPEKLASKLYNCNFDGSQPDAVLSTARKLDVESCRLEN